MALRAGPATFALLLAFTTLPAVASPPAEPGNVRWALARTGQVRFARPSGDDPAALRDAAESRIFQTAADREALEEGLALALRGAELARWGPKRDRPLAARLLVLAAVAENDLGRSMAALWHADEALRLQRSDADALYERGVALFELCRFTEARRSFARVLRRVPNDPWALYYLGLLAERAGEDSRAQRLLARAAQLAPDDLRPVVEVSPAEFEAEVRRAVASLPERERRSLDGVPVQVEDLPSLTDLTGTDPPLSPSILGLFRGPPRGEACTPDDGPVCRSIVLYRKNLSRFARDRREFAEQVRVTLLHEIGHLHGETDEALRARGLE
jgi:predicted Zn-dependent protease with MMP-like domain